jgi:hypothetical protein
MSTRTALPAAALLIALGAAACTGGAAPSAPASPGSEASGAPSPAASPVEQGIVHPTGADEIVLRLDSTGGFVPVEFIAGGLPSFTLYGDGRVVFQQTGIEPPMREDGVWSGYPLRTAVLSEAQVQELLEFALADGGLAVARPDYQNPLVADAPTSVFTINAENDSKTVSVVALGMEGEPGPDTAILKQLNALGERLRDFDQGGSIPSEPYEAPTYRGVIIEQQGVQGVNTIAWPWEDLTPEDFVMPADPNALQQGTHTLTPEQAAAVGVEGFENGVMSGVYLNGPDGTLYSLVIRPLLPDEDA